MSRSAKKPVLVQCSVVELDLVGYSHVARILEQQTDARVVQQLNEQVQGFVDDGLREIGRRREDVVKGTAGDNALLVFERASEAHRFAEAVHKSTAKYNTLKTDPMAYRHFRIGISTGEIAVSGKAISGTRIIDSVRLEAAGKKGHILIDEATYEELPAKFQQHYGKPEVVADKQNNSYSVYRCVVSEAGDDSVFTPGFAPLRKDSGASAGSTCPVDISRIIKYAPEELVGRDAEIKLLSDAWEKVVRGETKRPHVLTFVALGGEGKTSLVAKWAADLAFQDWPGCEAVFAWSFYSQGTREQTAVSSDSFLAEGLKFFGDAEMAGSPAGAFDKGRRLAQLAGERRALLILDGLEPLQYAPTSPTPGELKDAGIAALLKGLAATSRGLCVVTTRYGIHDLRVYWQTTAPMHELLRLSTAAGVKLLRTIGVRTGYQAEFERLVEDVDGHALTLQILGQFLVRAFHGDIRRRDRIDIQKADAKVQGGHAFRAMEAYVKWLENDSEESRREVALMKLLGLFDRPATADCMTALREAPAIPSLTEPLVGLAEEDLDFSLTSLRDAKLLTVNREAGSGELVALDAHPLLREYFARLVQQQQPEAWRAAHARLYEHLCATTPDKPQPTLGELQPLYQAVAHGCQGGMHQEACDEVYFGRILHGNHHYSWQQLGAVGSDLGAVACFFDQPWIRLSPSLRESDQSFLLAQAALYLRALGRLTESLESMRTGFENYFRQCDWKNAAIVSSNLSELELTLGEVVRALSDAEKSVTYADRSGNEFFRMACRTTLADALHQAGHRDEAKARFNEAERMQAVRQPAHPLLYSQQGFIHCDLLLSKAERSAWQIILRRATPTPLEHSNDKGTAVGPKRGSRMNGVLQSCIAVSKRAEQTLHWSLNLFNFGLLTIALDHLTLGRAALYAEIVEPAGLLLSQNGTFPQHRHSTEDGLPTTARRELDAAVTGLRDAGQQWMIVLGLLSRAWLRCYLRNEPSAQTDLDEAWEIAERGPMRLYMADIHLYRARLFHAVKPYPWTSPLEDLAAARKLIEKCGYGRRKEELEDAEAAAKNW